MKNFESLITKLLLIGYLITLAVPALPTESLNYLSAGKMKKVCKRSHAISQNFQHTPLQPAFSSAERPIKDVPQAVLLSHCGSSSTHLPASSENKLQLVQQQKKVFPAFAFTPYTILFQELDPDPPKVLSVQYIFWPMAAIALPIGGAILYHILNPGDKPVWGRSFWL